MILHTVLISYQRRELTEIALTSYMETVTVPYTLVVADNGSDAQTRRWLEQWFDEHIRPQRRGHLLLFRENRYPGYACNRGFEEASPEATHLHRADNDFRFLPGWCEAVQREFRYHDIGQVGLRTDEEECFAPWNVGGNMIIRRELWDQGLRYDERPWPEYPAGYSEDSYFSPAVREMGWHWRRVRTPCIESLASGDWNDDYYARSYGDRGIVPNPDDPLAPGTR